MKSKLFLVLFGLVACFVSRLLFVNSNVFFFDGDEAIVALMGLDALDGHFPLYFSGQNYGLSTLEALLVSFGVLIFGTSMLAVKVLMLALWSSAVSLLTLTFFKLSRQNKLATALFILVLITSPTWLVWSMKARGGYLSSFFFSSLILFLLVEYKEKLNLVIWAVIGVSLTLVYETHPIWLPCLLPIIGFFLWKQEGSLMKKLPSLGGFVTGGGISALAFYYVKSTIEVVYKAPQPNFAKRLTLIDQIPEVLLKTLGGNYFLSTSYQPSNQSYATIFLVAFLAITAIGIVYMVRQKRLGLSAILLLSTLFSFSGFLVKSEPRYLLPFFGFALLTIVSVYGEMENDKLKKGILGMSILLCLMGLSTMPNFNKYSFVNMSLTEVDQHVKNDEAVMEKLILKFKSEGVKYVFTTNEFLQYQLNYMSNNELLVVGRKDRCRIPSNVEDIMSAYAENANEFAIIGYNFRYGYTGKIPLVGNKIFYIIRPNKVTLEQVGFFKEIES
ncbi:MAG: hypothetical protein ACI9UR_002449 [Bacteroidia bacterium]|jgi:hypothetical protein